MCGSRKRHWWVGMKPNQPIAYVVSRFPKLTETFVLYELHELRRLGFHVLIMPLQRTRESVIHPEVDRVAEDVLHVRWFSPSLLVANIKWLVQHPVRYISTLSRAMNETWGNGKFWAGALVFFSKAVAFADMVQRRHVVHLHAHFTSHPALVAWVIHQLTGVSYSFTAHGTDLHADQRMLSLKARDAAFAVTISDYNMRFIAERCGAATAARFSVIRCGVDLATFRPSPRVSRSDAITIVCNASFREVKGHRYLLEACARLHERGIVFRCLFVGYGALRKAIQEQIVRLELEPYVQILGPQTRPEVVRLLGESDIAVLTSVQTRNGSREGIPVALMEAMACGLPVVASRISGIPELVEDGVAGYLVPPKDVDAIALALERLASDPRLRLQMGQAARRRVESEYDLCRNAQQLARRIEALRL